MSVNTFSTFSGKRWREQVKPSDGDENLGRSGSVPQAVGNAAALFIPANAPGLGSVPVLFAGLSPRFNSSEMAQDASVIVDLRRTRTQTRSESGNASLPPNDTNVVPQADDPPPTDSLDPSDDIHRGHWLEIHGNFLSYVLHTLGLHDGSSNEILQLSKQWAEWDCLTSLANYRSVVQILFGYLAVRFNTSFDSRFPTHHSRNHQI
ncbi:hypothetical protein C8R45DRAFT_959727 [Mycena sanguinolenta]|nr:hypothetical protein C8R45DRAFT_959727 [Mycena sanguinolenta]